MDLIVDGNVIYVVSSWIVYINLSNSNEIIVFSLYLSLSLSLPRSLFLSYSLSLSFDLSFSPSLSLSFSLSLFFSLSLSSSLYLFLFPSFFLSFFLAAVTVSLRHERERLQIREWRTGCLWALRFRHCQYVWATWWSSRSGVLISWRIDRLFNFADYWLFTTSSRSSSALGSSTR